ncbi:MAG: type IV toxin-antitoxin system AbiEi family antitoxin [bacterium]
MAYNYLEKYISRLQSQGRYHFSLQDLLKELSKQKSALHMGLKRLMDKGRIVRIRQGFYVIVPAEYSRQGMLPVNLFIHDLMDWLDKPYYVGLLSAAALHGAAHQQPQKYQVIIKRPQIRPVHTKDIYIQFVVKKDFPIYGVSEKKTDTGYIYISNPVMTAFDLLQFERQCGGFQRIVEIMEELTESFIQDDLRETLRNTWPNTVLQRFGYLCTNIVDIPDFTQPVLNKLKSRKIYPVPLSPGESSRAGTIDKTWKVILNIQPES